MQDRNTKAVNLEKMIQYHDNKYWVDNDPEISDPDYDKLVRELLEMEPSNRYLNRPKAPKVDSQGKVKHSIPMLSLDKAYSLAEVILFIKKTMRSEDEEYKVMFKLDGISGQDMHGILATRGDGEIGEDISHKRGFMNILTKGKPNFVRGEILFTKSKFKEIRDVITRKNGEKYKNERNAVQGILGRDDLDPVQILTFVDFEYICKVMKAKEFWKLSVDDWDEWCDKVKESNFPTDGIVIKLADEKYGESLGVTSKHPKSAIAFKFENPKGESIIRDIVLQQGKHELTPVAKIDPVEVDGVEITSPTMHNWANVLKRDARIGDIVIVERAGSVIPYVSKVIPGEVRTKIDPSKCPECGSDTIYDDPHLFCSNDECGGKLVNKISDAVIRIGIDRLGKPTIKKMIDTLDVENLIDIFNLTKDDIIKMPAFGETSTNNLYNEIQKVKEKGVYEWQLLAALNIPGIGRTLSKDLLTADRGLAGVASMLKADLEALPNIGKERAAAIRNGIFDNQNYLEALHQMLPILVPETKDPDGASLLKICFTGRFPEKKSYYYDLLKENGGYEIMEKVNKETQVLVVADPSKESNKMKSAKKKGIKIMGIDELMGGLNG